MVRFGMNEQKHGANKYSQDNSRDIFDDVLRFNVSAVYSISGILDVLRS